MIDRARERRGHAGFPTHQTEPKTVAEWDVLLRAEAVRNRAYLERAEHQERIWQAAALVLYMVFMVVMLLVVVL